MSVRAGIVITGTEVLTGIIADRNGPWLADELRAQGVELAHTTIVADRRADLLATLEFLARAGVDLIVTTGGLGPTADDLTAEVVAEFSGRELVLDEPLEREIAAILERLTARWPGLDQDAIRHGNRKQATIPAGATPLHPVGTAPGLVVPPGEGRSELPTVLVLPGPPGELRPMWSDALATEPLRAILRRTRAVRRRIIRIFGIPESELAQALRDFEADGLAVDDLEITTCLRAGEIEVATTFSELAGERYAALERALVERFGALLFARDGETIDELVGSLLAAGPRTIALAESCTGGLLAARLTDRPGSSAYVLGGVIAYADEAKRAVLGVDPEVIRRHGAVSAECARQMAAGARQVLGSDWALAITGVAGPGGGSPEKPVGLVHVALAGPGVERAEEHRMRGDRERVRERSAAVALHLLRRALEEARAGM